MTKKAGRVIRTPDKYFDNLPDFPFTPHFAKINGLRVHYLDEGTGELILCLHGEPTWSYLYRKMIPILSARYRVTAMDFIGFGRSDKFIKQKAYSFQMHSDTLLKFIDALSLEQITLVMHNWGGLIGLRVATLRPKRFARLVILNTGLSTGEGQLPEEFHAWRRFVKEPPSVSIEQVMGMALKQREAIPAKVIAAYKAPFPDKSYAAGAIAWPLLVPIHPDDPGALEMRQTQEALSKWDKPVQVIFSDRDPLTQGQDIFFRNLIPTAKDQPKIVIKGAGHFLQEEKGEEIAQHIVNFIARTPLG
ncbi:haloalkane dehalogenase [Candidatus Omnitrophota bacterium]